MENNSIVFNDHESNDNWLELERNINSACKTLGVGAQWIESFFRELLEPAIKMMCESALGAGAGLNLQRFYDVVARYYLYRELCALATAVKASEIKLIAQEGGFLAAYTALAPTLTFLQRFATGDAPSKINRHYTQLLTTPNNVTAIHQQHLAFRTAFEQLETLNHFDERAVELMWLKVAYRHDPERDAKRVYRYLTADQEQFEHMSPLPELPDITLAQFTAMLPTTVSALDVARVTADRTTFNVLEVSLLAKRIIEGE